MKTHLLNLVKTMRVPVDSGAVLRYMKERTASVQIVTLNAEMALAALDDDELYRIIQNAEMVVADSIAIAALLRCVGRPTTRMGGIDLAWRLAHEKSLQPVGLIGGALEETAHRATALFQKNGIMSSAFGRGPDFSEKKDTPIPRVAALHASQVQLVCVGFGHSKQERWIDAMRASDVHLRVWIGVGGALDVWAGDVRRAPVWMQRVGLEWAWRLVLQPRRITRIFRATVIFPARALWELFISAILKAT